ncbi:MAG TPA: ATP-binding protein [Stellaceae bacterium]|nr:ATP-binding protein [Stellaceae bacterium]
MRVVPIEQLRQWRDRTWLAWLEAHNPRRILALVGALLITAIVSTAWVTIWTSRQSDLDSAGRELRRLSLVLAGQTSRSMLSIDLILRGLAERFAASGVATPEDVDHRLGSGEIRDLLRDRIRDAPQIDAIAVQDSKGMLVTNSRQGPLPQLDLGDRDYFSALRDQPSLGVFIGAPTTTRVTGRSVIFLARRLNGPGGEFLGVVVAAIETRYLSEFYSAVSPGAQGAISLYRDDGILLARFPDSDENLGKSYAGQPFLLAAHAETDPRPLRRRGLVHPEYLISAPHAVPGYPLVVNVNNKEAAILSDWSHEATVIAGIAAAAILLIAVVGWLLARLFALQAQMGRSLADRAKALHAQEVAETASQAKTGFLANMSHELRTPLNAIIGFTEMLTAGYVGSLNERQGEYVRDIGASGVHLLGLINAVLDMSKIEAGRFDLLEEAVDVSSLVDDTLAFLRVRAADTEVTLRKVIERDLPRLRGDRRTLLQVLLNLASNAVNFSMPGGTVTISAGITGEAGMEITVADTGIGIDPKQLAHIFEPFQRTDPSRSRRHGGSGLGLSISKLLVERHGGTLSLTSKLGAGTTVTLRLPADRLLKTPPPAAGQRVAVTRSAAD